MIWTYKKKHMLAENFFTNLGPYEDELLSLIKTGCDSKVFIIATISRLWVEVKQVEVYCVVFCCC